MIQKCCVWACSCGRHTECDEDALKIGAEFTCPGCGVTWKQETYHRWTAQPMLKPSLFTLEEITQT